MEKSKTAFPVISKKQNVEFGLVAVMISCILAYWLNERSLVLTAIVLCLIAILLPVVFYPFAALWFGLSKVMSRFGSTLLLGLVFFVVVTPVGWLRRMMGKDSLRLKQFKAGTASVLVSRNHQYTAADMTDTF